MNNERKNKETLVLLLLSLFLDCPVDEKHVSPETIATFPSVLLFNWFNSLAWTGYKESIMLTRKSAKNPEKNPRNLGSRYCFGSDINPIFLKVLIFPLNGLNSWIRATKEVFIGIRVTDQYNSDPVESLSFSDSTFQKLSN